MVFGDGPTRLDVWLDFQCPNCKTFEATYGEAIGKAIAKGSVTLVVHPLSFPRRESSERLIITGGKCVRLFGRGR